MSQSLFKNLASHDRTRQSIKYRKSQRARESLMLLTNEREETANSHTCAHMHTPNWTNWKLSLLWKAVFYVFFAQTTRSVISPVFKFCLCVICWFQLISDLFLFDSVFTAFVVSTHFQLCHDRTRDVYRDPSFLFPKAPKKKGWSSLCSISAECAPWDKVRPVQGFTDFCFMILQVLMCRNPENENYLPKTNNHKITFLNGAHVCLCFKILIYVFHCFAWKTFTELSLQRMLGTNLNASLYLGNTPCYAFSFLTSKIKASICSCVQTICLTSQNGD